MDWAKLSKTPLPTVLAVLAVILAVIAAPEKWGKLGTYEPPQFGTVGRIGLTLLALLLLGAAFYLYRSRGHRDSGGSNLRDQGLEPQPTRAERTGQEVWSDPAPQAPHDSRLPEITNIQLKPLCESWAEVGDGRGEFERKVFDYDFAEDPVFEITVQNNSSSSIMLYKVGVRLIRREPGRFGGCCGGTWDYRTRQMHTEVKVHCPDEWKRMNHIDDRNSRASEAFMEPIEMNSGGSRYFFGLMLENFVDLSSSTTSKLTFYLVTDNNRIIESRPIMLHQ
jgi:hypothetical protein